MQTIRVTADGPLLETLAAQVGNRTRVKEWLKLRRIAVNGATAERHDVPLAAGDTVTIGPPRPVLAGQSVARIPIVFGDADVLVVDKPTGLLTIATDTERSRTAYAELTEFIKQTSPGGRGRIFIVHRLDRETSGLLVFARTPDAKQRLQDGWDDVEKHYLAVVDGVPEQPAGTIESELTETAAMTVFSGRKTGRSKHAVTHYQLLKTNGVRSLLEVRLETGRKHQIRVHLSDINCPVSGDDRYGRRRKSCSRLALHAARLSFPHPATGERMTFESELPRSLVSLLKPVPE